METNNSQEGKAITIADVQKWKKVRFPLKDEPAKPPTTDIEKWAAKKKKEQNSRNQTN